MIEIQEFATVEAALGKLDAFFRYENPSKVAPLKGAAAHEVAVGPVHAGVIEPGHFRFQTMGEDVYNLQIFLGYQHRGVEEEIVRARGNVPRQLALAETCAGDSSVAAATALSEILESSVPAADRNIRGLLLELERIANHVGDLGALAGDVAYLPTSSFCGRIRGEYLNMTALFCGNRFGRGAVVPGGVRAVVTPEKLDRFKTWISSAKKDLDGALALMFEEPTVIDRLSGTGTVPREIAREYGLVGVARRASVEFDGDVLARAKVRRVEIEEAHAKIFSYLDALAATNISRLGGSPAQSAGGGTGSARVVVSTVAAWRGPLVHAAAFDANGAMIGYRIVDPSAHNWQGLAYALRGEQISNFPICNKSFNLSYCGTDR